MQHISCIYETMKSIGMKIIGLDWNLKGKDLRLKWMVLTQENWKIQIQKSSFGTTS